MKLAVFTYALSLTVIVVPQSALAVPVQTSNSSSGSVSTSATTGDTSQSSSTDSVSSSSSASSGTVQTTSVQMNISGVDSALGTYAIKEIYYGNRSWYFSDEDGTSGLYKLPASYYSAYVYNSSAGDSFAYVNVPTYLDNYDTVIVVGGYEDATPYCNDYFDIGSSLQSNSTYLVATFSSTAGECLEKTLEVFLKNTTKLKFTKPRPTPDAENEDFENYESLSDYEQKMDTYLKGVGLNATQIESLCKDNGCSGHYGNPQFCIKKKLTWKFKRKHSATVSVYDLSADCECTQDPTP